MPKEKTTSTRKSKTKAETVGKKKKGKSAASLLMPLSSTNTPRGPQRAQAWSVRLHVLRQRAARQREKREPGYHLW